MVVAKHAKELVGLAHTNMLEALGNADPTNTEQCYGLINNLFQIIRLEDFYTELGEIQGAEVIAPKLESRPEVDNLTQFPTVVSEPKEEMEGQVSLFQEGTEPVKPEKVSTKTFDEVKKVMTKAAQAGKNIKAILDKRGVGKLSDLSEATYDAVYAEAEALLSEV